MPALCGNRAADTSVLTDAPFSPPEESLAGSYRDEDHRGLLRNVYLMTRLNGKVVISNLSRDFDVDLIYSDLKWSYFVVAQSFKP